MPRGKTTPALEEGPQEQRRAAVDLCEGIAGEKRTGAAGDIVNLTRRARAIVCCCFVRGGGEGGSDEGIDERDDGTFQKNQCGGGRRRRESGRGVSAEEKRGEQFGAVCACRCRSIYELGPRGVSVRSVVLACVVCVGRERVTDCAGAGGW
jgi:hypothetical protein